MDESYTVIETIVAGLSEADLEKEGANILDMGMGDILKKAGIEEEKPGSPPEPLTAPSSPPDSEVSVVRSEEDTEEAELKMFMETITSKQVSRGSKDSKSAGDNRTEDSRKDRAGDKEEKMEGGELIDIRAFRAMQEMIVRKIGKMEDVLMEMEKSMREERATRNVIVRLMEGISEKVAAQEQSQRKLMEELKSLVTGTHEETGGKIKAMERQQRDIREVVAGVESSKKDIESVVKGMTDMLRNVAVTNSELRKMGEIGFSYQYKEATKGKSEKPKEPNGQDKTKPDVNPFDEPPSEEQKKEEKKKPKEKPGSAKKKEEMSYEEGKTIIKASSEGKAREQLLREYEEHLEDGNSVEAFIKMFVK